MTQRDFDHMTPRSVTLLMEQYTERHKREYREKAELLRVLILQASNMIAAGQGAEPIDDPRRFVQFGWEEDMSKELADDLMNTNWDVLDNIYTKN